MSEFCAQFHQFGARNARNTFFLSSSGFAWHFAPIVSIVLLSLALLVAIDIPPIIIIIIIILRAASTGRNMRREGEGAGGDGVERGSTGRAEGKEGSVNRVPLS